MYLTPFAEGSQSVLFNVTEIDEELAMVKCSIDMAEYLIWVLVDLGYPVFTPPWMAEPKLPLGIGRVRNYHLSEVQTILGHALGKSGYSGETLIVCALGRTHCSISFTKERIR